MVISCPQCGQRLMIPDSIGGTSFRCPTCQRVSYLDPDQVSQEAPRRAHSPSGRPSFVKRHVNMIVWTAIVGILIIAFITVKKPGDQPTAPTPTGNLVNWITVEYGNLLDREAIIRTGERLVSSLAEPELKGAIQPFVDGYSYLLQHAVETLRGPDAVPYHSVVDHFPIGARQPAWVAILRGGRIAILTDNQDHARIFLPGESPRVAYEQNYPVIRHCLKALLAEAGTVLNVEVFAYRHEYSRSELYLNDRPYVFNDNDFASPAKTPLDLGGLSEFFAAGGQLEGIQIDEREGLILYSREGKRETMAGQPLDLSDLSVAYRAVFHAGDNDAYISLDPHIDPTRVTVNFGGFLEDTRIGSVVLEADKRFKTIASGLDPNTYRDVRSSTRNFVPSFLAGNERDFLAPDNHIGTGWIGTRYWFYPNSIEVETDNEMRYGRVSRPRFTADAERSRDDFASPQEFELRKQKSLSASIRECIDHVNSNYEIYETAYQEIRDLTTVARLMGVCSWLKQANPRNVDLDALLSVEIPAFQTERERTQMISVAYMAYSKQNLPDADYVKRYSRVINLSPILDMTVQKYFKNAANVEKYLNLRDKEGKKSSSLAFIPPAFSGASQQILSDSGKKPVRSLIKTKADLQALANYASDQIDVPASDFRSAKESRLSLIGASLKGMKKELTQLKNSADIASSASLANYFIDQYNELVVNYEYQRQAYLQLANEIDQDGPDNVRSLMRISGGINLESKYFKIQKVPESATLRKFVTMTTLAEANLKARYDGHTYLKSRPGKNPPNSHALPRSTWEAQNRYSEGGVTFDYRSAGDSTGYWRSENNSLGQWRSSAVFSSGQYAEKESTGPGKLLILTGNKGDKQQAAAIVAEKIGRDRIVFRKSTNDERPAHSTPPAWWISR